MALDNLISIEFDAQETQIIDNALKDIQNVLKKKVVNLTPAERRKYGVVKYKRSPWVKKCHAYMKSNPALVPSYIDMNKFEKDLEAREVLNNTYPVMVSILESIDDTIVLLGRDIYFNCISFYKAVKAASMANVPGTTTIYEDLQKYFPGRPRTKKNNMTPEV